MSRHQFDLVMCMKQQGTHLGYLCDKCDGRCPICDSHNIKTINNRNNVNNTTRTSNNLKKVRICDSCSFGNLSHSCIICNNPKAQNVAYYCWECCQLERNKDGCPQILNVGSTTIDRHFDPSKKKPKAM